MEPELKFEKALERLEKIVQDLEGGNLSLEEALKKYEEGVKLSRTCAQKLEQAESKVEVLTRALNGTSEISPLDQEGDAKKGSRKKEKKTQKKDEGEAEDLLL